MASIVWILLFVPIPLLALAYLKPEPSYAALIVLTLSAILAILAGISPHAKLILMGANYSPPLYARIELNLAAVLIAGVWMAVKRQWLAAVAALILLFEWLSAAVVNSVV